MNLVLPQANRLAKVCLAFLFISLQYNKSIMKTGAMAIPKPGPDSKCKECANRLLAEKWCCKMSNRTIHVLILDGCLTSVETSKRREVSQEGSCSSASDSMKIALSVNNSLLFFNWSRNLEDDSSSLSSNCTICSDWSCLLLVSTPNSSCPQTISLVRNETVRNEIPALMIAIGAVGGALVLLIVVLLCILFRSKARRRRELKLQSCTRNDAVQLPQSPESCTREENDTEQDDVNSELGSPSSVSSGGEDEDNFVSPPQMENPLRNDVGYTYPQDGRMALYSEGNSDRYSYPEFGTDSYQEDPADCYSYPELGDGLYSGDSADGYSYPDLTDIPEVNGDTGDYCYAYAHTFNRRKPKCPHYVNVSLKKPKTSNPDSTRLEPEANVESPPIVEYVEACSDNEHCYVNGPYHSPKKDNERNDDVDTPNSMRHEETTEPPVNVEYIPVM